MLLELNHFFLFKIRQPPFKTRKSSIFVLDPLLQARLLYFSLLPQGHSLLFKIVSYLLQLPL
jgi:hypothetical protein